jgi:voltage-gated potassium channel
MTRVPSDPPPQQPERREREAATLSERFELLEHLQAILEPLMTILGIVFLGLLLLDYSSVSLSGAAQARLDWTLQAIWVVFLVDFLLRFAVAPAKGLFLRRNWLAALSLALPFLRPLRAFRAARVLRSLSLARLVGGLNRAARVLREVTRGRRFAYVGLLTLVVVVAGAVGVLYFDRGVEGAPIRTFGDALWWSTTMVTTINSELYAVSPEARALAVLLRIYAVSVFGLITAAIATYLIGAASSAKPGETEEGAQLHAELASLRAEVGRLGDLLTGATAQSREAESTTEDTRGDGPAANAHRPPHPARRDET